MGLNLLITAYFAEIIRINRRKSTIAANFAEIKVLNHRIFINFKYF